MSRPNNREQARGLSLGGTPASVAHVWLENTEGQGGVRTYQLRTGGEAGEVWQPPAAAHGWPSVSDTHPNRSATKLVP